MPLRVFQLAKDLGVKSRDVLEKCKAEGLSIKSHNSVLNLGQEATIREWFSEGAHTTTVETADRVDLKKVRRRVKKKPPEAPPPAEAPVPVAEAPAEAAPVAEVVAEAPLAEVVPGKEGVLPAAPMPEVTEAEVPTEAPPEAPAEAPAEALAIAQPEPVAEMPSERPEPVAEAPVEPEAAAPPEPEAPEEPEIPEVEAAGPQVVPAPAQLRGPEVVRVERAEHVPPPRRRERPGPRPPKAGPPTPVPEAAIPERAGVARGRKKPGDEKAQRRPRPRHSRRAQKSYEVTERLREWRDRDLIERRERLDHATGRLGRLTTSTQPARRRDEKAAGPKTIEVPASVSVRELSSLLGVKVSEIIARLMGLGLMASINEQIGADVAEVIAADYDVVVTPKEEKSAEQQVLEAFEKREPEKLVPRAPVVTFLGHVDHGKTSLLDYIRRTRVAEGEAGGITQHIGAYQVDLPSGRRVVFLDTPGHEAFTAMRGRGARMTDVVVLVVAADDGVMPQTVEAIDHAKAAGVAIVVALNKMDKAEANVTRVLGQLAERELSPAEWGGSTEVVRTSAISGDGIKELVDLLSLEAEMLDLKADPEGPARGTVIEARMTPGRGVLAQLLIQDGTLRVGEVIWAGVGSGRVRSMTDSYGKSITEAGPSTPVEISGLDQVPDAGDRFFVLPDISQAEKLALGRSQKKQEASRSARPALSLEELTQQIAAGQAQELRLVLKADVQGSVEVVHKALEELGTDEVKVRILHEGVGAVSEGDVLLAEASEAVVLGFNVSPDDRVRSSAEAHGVELRTYTVIYELIEDVRKALEGLLEPEVRENVLGQAEVRQTFKISRVGTIAGCQVMEGLLRRGGLYRLVRDGTVVREQASLDSLRRFKEDAREVRAGLECGVHLAGFDDVKVGDRLECYERVEVKRTLGRE